MQRGTLALGLVVALAAAAHAAAPPAKWCDLTAREQEEVAALQARLERHAAAGEFERAAGVAGQIANYRARRQGTEHWRSIDARYDAENWTGLAAVPAKDRPEVMRARALAVEAKALLAKGHFQLAEKRLRLALAIHRKTLGEGHAHTASSYGNLAYCLEDLGKASEALPLYRRALEIQRKALGGSHPTTATAYNNVGSCLDSLGKAAEALPLYRTALAIREKALGQNHPDTAGSYNNVGLCLNAMGRHAEALPLLRKALAAREKVLGKEHPTTAGSYNNVAFCLSAQGGYAEALLLLRRALEIQRKALGDGHPSTGTAYNNVAHGLSALGKASEALPLFRKALVVREEALGQGHPSTATSYNNVAACLRNLGRLPEALPLFQKALAIREKALGEDHPDRAQSYDNVASCLSELGKASEALPLHRKALAIRLKVLGEDHPDTAASLNNVAHCLTLQARPAEALPLFRKALAIRRQVLGEIHPDTATSYGNVASCLVDLGKVDEAVPLYRKALAAHLKVLGESHPVTARSCNNLALCLATCGELGQAARLWQQSLAGQEAARFHLANESGFDRAVAQSGKFSARAGLAAALAHLKQPRNAFAQAEASLARGLLDDLASDSNPEVARLNALRGRLSKLDSALVAFAGLAEPTAARRAQHAAYVREQRAVLSELAQIVAEDSARRVLPLHRIQASIPEDAALVLWVDVGGRYACVVRSQRTPAWVRLPGSGKGGVPTEEDRSLPSRLHKALTDPGTSQPERRELSGAFLKQLFDPVRPHLKGVKRLFVVPTGPLARVPLEAVTPDFSVSYTPSGSVLARLAESSRPVAGTSLLAVGDPAFDRRPPPEPPASGVLVLSVLPGGNAAKAGLQPGDVILSVGAVGMESKADLEAALEQTPATVTFWRGGKVLKGRLPAEPLGAAVDPRSPRAAVRAWRKSREATAVRGTGHKRLPGTRLEVEAISALVKGSTKLLGSEASEQRLDGLRERGELKKYRLLHFATHGEAVEAAPGLSALILAQDALPDAPEQGGKGLYLYDGRLTVSRVRNDWKGEIDADLVVLSACETGLGRDAKGDGLLGFAHAFLSAGARSVVLSRWKVDDSATALLMVRFYENLLGKRKGLVKGMGRAAALDEAKKWLRTLSREEAGPLAALYANGILRGTEADRKPAPKGKPGALPEGDRPFEHPYYWAAFTLVGDPD